jgi:predicted enzyme related to lactoylglutathione lyase
MMRIAATTALTLGASYLLFGQASPPAEPPKIPSILNILPVSGNLDQAELFYHEMLGLQSDIGDPRARLLWYPQKPFIDDMYGVKGDNRNFFLRVPGSDLTIEITQFSGAKGKRLDTHVQDPGAVQLIFTVNNIDILTGYLTKGGAKVITAGGRPVHVTDGTGSARAILFRDFDGFFVKLVQPDGPPPPPAPNGAPPNSFITGVTIGVTVDDTEKTARFYHELLGLDVNTKSSFIADAKQMDAVGLKSAQYRESAVMFPEKTPPLHLFAFKGVDRKPLHPGVADPDSVLIRILVQDLDHLKTKVNAAGGQITNISGGITVFLRNRFLIVTDPNGAHLQLLERTPGP